MCNYLVYVLPEDYVHISYTFCFRCDIERGSWQVRQLVEKMMNMDGSDGINAVTGGTCF